MWVEVKKIKEVGSCSECLKPSKFDKVVVSIKVDKTKFLLCEEHAHDLKNKLHEILQSDEFYDD